jgi:hypothetical protein
MGVYRWGMDMVPLTPERKAQLDDYAQRRGKDTAASLDDVLADALAWEREDYRETVDSIRGGYEGVKAGRARPAGNFFAEKSYG